MKRRGGSSPVSGPLEIGAATIRRQLLTMVTGALSEVRLVEKHNRAVVLTGWLLIGLFLAAAALLVVRHRRLRAQSPLLRLDEAGMSLFDGRTVGWGEIGEVREVGKGTALAFLPRGAAELPPFAPVLLPSSAEGVARRRMERYGTPLVLSPVALDVSREDILAAVRRYGGAIPVTGVYAGAVPV
jgi:hypothetical protein